MKKSKKKVYVGLSADILHKGHINILKTANTYGDVYVGLLTDQAISSYKNIPYLDFEKRKIVIENIKYVKKVIPQKTLDYVENLNIIKPKPSIFGNAILKESSTIASISPFLKFRSFIISEIVF